ncbi:MAG TPA: DUF5686 family protein [Chitinophagaceae bacterium]
MPKQLYLLILPLFCYLSGSGQYIRGTVTDSTGKPLAFATIKIGNTRQGLIADLKGNFAIRKTPGLSYLLIGHLGYKTKKVEVSEFTESTPLVIQLVAAPSNLEEVVVKSTASKVTRILSTAIANRNRNNPEKYDWYRCNIYYKTILTVVPDSTLADTSSIRRSINEYSADKHAFITETFSRRTWERPQKLQEEVLGTRISGFKKAWFSSLVTDVLPFHAYTDFLNLNGKDYPNPLSNGFNQRFRFRLEDEILQGSDTIWHISFVPRRDEGMLTGSIFISSNGFAITNLTASHYDPAIKRVVGIEQQYALEQDRWFPEQLNYFITWKNIMNSPVEVNLNGHSVIDSVSFNKDERFRFDKAHTAKLVPGADELSDTAWSALRPIALDSKERRTYVYVDSIGEKAKLDKLPSLVANLSEGFLPWGKVDIDLQRIYSYNRYEQHRIGFGLRTSDRISKRFKAGAWFGYGTGDKNLKYGGWAEYYADRYKEFSFRFNYRHDLQDPGRLQINPELDRNFLRKFLLGRVDKITAYTFEINKRLGYWQTGIALNFEQIRPQYNYELVHGGKTTTGFDAREVILSLRYAYAERMTPMLGRYFSTGSKFPVFYSRIRFGEIDQRNQYIHAVAAVKWQKHINRFGNEQFLLMAGAAFSDQPLPLSKLFAGNGFQLENNALYVFGGMQTMLPYQYYSDRFVNFYWKHEFDFRFYKLNITRGLSSAPSPGIGYNVLWGELSNKDAHRNVSFSVPDPAYHEVGLVLNRLLRLKFMGLYHLNFNLGYFYHLSGPFDHQRNGRFVFGLGVDL